MPLRQILPSSRVNTERHLLLNNGVSVRIEVRLVGETGFSTFRHPYLFGRPFVHVKVVQVQVHVGCGGRE